MHNKPIIVGAGPAGMSAAMELAKYDVSSMLLDEAPRCGGVVYRGPLREGVALDYLGGRYKEVMKALHQQFEIYSNRIDVKLNTRVIGEANQQLYVLNEQDQLSHIPYSQLLLSMGCHERSVPFPGWTLPGVMMLGGLQLQIKSGVVLPPDDIALVGTGPLLPLVACQLHRAGAKVVGIYEACSLGKMSKEIMSLLNQSQLFLDGLSMLAYLKLHRVPLYYGWGVVSAQGGDELEAVTVAPYDANWAPDLPRQRQIKVRTLAVGYGFIPRTQLTQQMSLEHDYDETDGCLKPIINAWQCSSLPYVHLAGDVGGLRGGEMAMLSGKIAALSILKNIERISAQEAAKQHALYTAEQANVLRFRAGVDRFTQRGMGQLQLAMPDTLICRCENVTRQAIDTAIAQGVGDLISLKMRTRISMGDCQGKMCVGYCSDRLRQATGKLNTGWIRPRFPIDPLPFSAFKTTNKTEVEES